MLCKAEIQTGTRQLEGEAQCTCNCSQPSIGFPSPAPSQHPSTNLRAETSPQTRQIVTASSYLWTWRSIVFSPGAGGGRTVNHGILMIIQIVELLMKEKNPLFLSSMYLGVRLNRAADYLFYVTNHLCKRHDSVCL